MGEVVELGCMTTLDIPVEKILNGAAKSGLEEVAVLGICEDGSFYFASSRADMGSILWLFELAKNQMLHSGD